MKPVFIRINNFFKNILLQNQTYWQRVNFIVGPALKKDFEEIGQKDTRNAFEKFIIQNSKKKTLLLDAGCNTGVEGYRLFEKGFKGKYVGVDSNAKAISYAKKNLTEFNNVDFIVSDLTKIPFYNKFFDIVLIKDVIEHQKYYDEILKELIRVTKKHLILSLFIKMTSNKRDEIKRHRDGYYLNKYSKDLLIKFFTEKGFNKPRYLYSNYQDQVLIFERITKGKRAKKSSPHPFDSAH